MLYGKLAFHMRTRIMRGEEARGQPLGRAAERTGHQAGGPRTELGVSRQTISSLEKGRYNPSILLAFKIARRFGMQIEDVFIYQEDDHEE